MQFWWEGAALCWQWIEWLGIFAKIDSLGFSLSQNSKDRCDRAEILLVPSPPNYLSGEEVVPPLPLIGAITIHPSPPQASSPTHPHPPPWPPHPPTPTEHVYILFLHPRALLLPRMLNVQWQWLVIWICLLCLKFLSNLIPLIPAPPLLLIVCGLPPSPIHGCWRIAMKGSFIHPLFLTPITITTHIHPKDLSLFALSPKKGGR